MIKENTIERIENAVREVNREVGKKSVGKSWKRLCENDLFAELVSCIIGSQISFEKAKSATADLRQRNLLSVESFADELSDSENDIYSVLKEQGCLYSKAKASYIVRSGRNIYSGRCNSLKNILLTAEDQYEARETLSDLCLGIGLKQASLFLRNIDYADNLAILDSHVINYMGLLGMANGLKKSLTRTLYLSYEDELRSYSRKFNTSIAQLDVSIWVVMRTVSREFKWML
ncbi:MAG: hypothetical protein ABIJ40_20855 [Bacteroidota bacterium]